MGPIVDAGSTFPKYEAVSTRLPKIPENPAWRTATYAKDTAEAVIALADSAEETAEREVKMLFWTRVAE